MRIVGAISKNPVHATVRRGLLLAGMAGLFCLGACSDRSQEIEEQITQLQKKNEALQNQLDAANHELSNAREAQERNSTPTTAASDSSVSGSLPTRAALEQSYETSAKNLKNEISSKLTTFRIDSCVLHSVQMPANPCPYTSTISFSFRSRDGKAYKMDVPVQADFKGTWIFPNSNDIVAKLESSAASVVARATPTVNSSVRSTTPAAPPRMAVDGTVAIQWGDQPAANNTPVPTAPPSNTLTEIAVDQPAATAPPAQLQPTAAPTARQPAMQTDRDVEIKFDP